MPPQLTLEMFNRIVHDRLLEKHHDFQATESGPEEKKRKAFHTERFCDYNRAEWFIEYEDGVFKLSARISCWEQLKKHGAEAYLKGFYKEFFSQPLSGYNVGLKVDFNTFKGDIQKLATDFAQLQKLMLIAPALVIHQEMQKGQVNKLVQVDYRPAESYWVRAAGDRITVIFSIFFETPDDAIFGRTFLQEFSKQPQGCPSCDVISRKNADPPGELKSVQKLSRNNCYVSFLLEKRHWQKVSVFDVIFQFRNYVHYHVKCSKAFLHIRMRNKVDTFEKVLNRARKERMLVEKKTITGKRFEQK